MASVKGGTGKSVTSIGLGIEISTRLREQDKWVLLIDGDRHVRSTELKMCPISKKDPTLEDVLEGRAEWEDAVYRCSLKRGKEYLYPNLCIMPAGATFMPTASIPQIHRAVDRFDDIIAEAKERCAYVIVDCPASFTLDHYMLLACSDALLPVVHPSDDAINATDEMLKALRDIILYVDVAGSVINHVPEGLDIEPWVKKVESKIGQVLSLVPEDPAVDRAFSQNLPTAALYPNAPSVRAIKTLADRLLALHVPETKFSVASKLERTVDVLAREEIERRKRRRKKS